MTRDETCNATVVCLARFLTIPTLAVPEKLCGALPRLILEFFDRFEIPHPLLPPPEARVRDPTLLS